MNVKYWLIYFFITALIGFTKAHHFIRLVILAGLGLAGLWMVHTLAQDYNKIQASDADTRIFKRSIIDNQSRQINWETVLSRDPVSCIRSFLCQIAATDKKYLSKEEFVMLQLSRSTSQNKPWINEQLQEAIKNGEESKNPNKCMEIYKYCPYTSQMMLSLLKIFG